MKFILKLKAITRGICQKCQRLVRRFLLESQSPDLTCQQFNLFFEQFNPLLGKQYAASHIYEHLVLANDLPHVVFTRYI